MTTPVRFIDHDGSIGVGTLREIALGRAVDVWCEGRLRSFRIEKVRRLCGKCATKMGHGRRVPKHCQACEGLEL